MKMFAAGGEGMPNIPVEATLVLNSASPLINGLSDKAANDKDTAELIARQIYSLALISQRKLSADELRSFLSDSYGILGKF